MSSTLLTTTATITITEQFVSGEQTLNYVNKVAIPNVKPNDARVMSLLTASESTIVAFSTVASAGTFIAANVKYIRITNKDDTNFARIRVTKTSGQTFDIKLEAGKSFVMGNTKESANTGGSSFSAYVDADNISGQADTAAVDIEYLVLSI